MGIKYKLTAKPKNSQSGPPFVQHFPWLGPSAPTPHVETIVWQKDGAKFVANIELEPGNHGLMCWLKLSGNKVEIDFDPRPPVIQPFGADWPFKVEVSDTETQIVRTRYFSVGGQS